MTDKSDILQGTLALMVLKTLQVMGPLHGYGIARRIEQTSGDLLSINYGTDPVQLKAVRFCEFTKTGMSTESVKSLTYLLISSSLSIPFRSSVLPCNRRSTFVLEV
ncbi:PadR family transcriptional regulator [bacterium]|nr:PadR family transcriptional regulator [bacterium]